MRTLYVIVHPEASHHIEKVVGGWYDSHLTPTGHLAASTIASVLRARIPRDAQVELYSSDLKRTAETAQPIAVAFGASVIYDRRLREKSYGVAHGKPESWHLTRFIPQPACGDQERLEHSGGIEGAETKRQWASRLYSAMENILSKDCKHQIIVTHGGSITYVIAAWIKMPIESAAYVNFKATPGSITTLVEDDFWHNRQVSVLGDISHLKL